MAGIPYYLSYGAESGGLKHAVPVTDGRKMDCPAMKSEHGISDFTIRRRSGILRKYMLKL